jgi:hypothetical protein
VIAIGRRCSDRLTLINHGREPMKIRRSLAAAIAALGIAAAAPVVAPAAPPAVQPTKTCSGGFVHGVIQGSQKCLRRGEFCARAADRQYRRYGFRCVSHDARGNYHLT